MNIPVCMQCHNRVLGPPLGPGKGREVVGCKALTSEKWDEGWKDDVKGHLYQHNCPLITISMAHAKRQSEKSDASGV